MVGSQTPSARSCEPPPPATASTSRSTSSTDGATDRLEIGHIARAHGLRGEVSVVLTTNRTERLDRGSVLYAGDRALEVVASRPHQQRWLVTFAGVADRDAAEALRGSTLAAAPLDEPDALWVHEIVGRTVVDHDGVTRGVVTEVQANPASDLLVLDDGTLVPVVFVRPGDGSGPVVVDAPIGLFP